jgi:hypothetical protein
LTYADSGFVVSLYRPTESLSVIARREIKRAPAPIFLSPLSLLEIRNALNLAIARGEIEAPEKDAVMVDIDRLMEEGFFRLVQVSQTAIYAKAEELSDRHTSTVSSRSLDLMHVAAALLCKAQLFLSTDVRQRQVALAEGLAVKP